MQVLGPNWKFLFSLARRSQRNLRSLRKEIFFRGKENSEQGNIKISRVFLSHLADDPRNVAEILFRSGVSHDRDVCHGNYFASLPPPLSLSLSLYVCFSALSLFTFAVVDGELHAITMSRTTTRGVKHSCRKFDVQGSRTSAHRQKNTCTTVEVEFSCFIRAGAR